MTGDAVRYVYQPPPYPTAPAPAGSPEEDELLPHERYWLTASISRITLGDPVVPLLRRLVASGKAPAFQDLARLLPTLWQASPGRWRSRSVMCWLLGRWRLEEAERDRAAQALCAVLHGAKQGVFETPTARAAVFAALISVLTLLPSIGQRGPSLLAAAVFIGVIWSIAVLALLPGYRSGDKLNRNTERRIALAALGRLGVVESIPAIAKEAAGKDAELQRVAVRALERALPRLTSEHYGRLSAEVVPNLCVLLKAEHRGVNRLTVLNALEKIGDGRAIPAVQKLADDVGTVAVRAREVMQVLEARVREASEPYRLLRPSETGEPDNLLRAAGPGKLEPEETLLRPRQDSN